MNKRIEELAKQANIWKPIHNHKTWVPGEYIASPGELEKFAELIVRECIGVIGEENYTMLTGKAYCTKLKRHFGV